MSKKINLNDIDNLDYTETLEEEAAMAKKTKRTNKTKKNKEEETMIEETINTIEETTTTTTTNNKEEETMTENTIKTTKTANGEKVENSHRIINKITLEKNSEGVYDWKYTQIDANGISMASVKEDYTDKVEFTLNWKLNGRGIPNYLVATQKELNNKMFEEAAKSAIFDMLHIDSDKNGDHVPEAIKDKDGNVKIAVFASQDGVKSGERYFIDPNFVENHKNEGAMVDYSADPLMAEYVEARRELSLLYFELIPMYLNALTDNSLNAKIGELSEEVNTLMVKVGDLYAKLDKSLLHENFGVAAANQVTAFFYTPCKKKGTPMKVKIMDEIKVNVDCRGYVDTNNTTSWGVEDNINGKTPYMEISIDDGSAFVDPSYAAAHGFFGGDVKDMTQARCGIGHKNGKIANIAMDFKGTIQIVDMPEGMKDAIYISSSSAKGLKRFSKEDIESCEYQFYTMDRNVHTDGHIDIGPQVMMYILTRAEREEIERIIKAQVEELRELATEKGYKKLVAKMTQVEYYTKNWENIASFGHKMEYKDPVAFKCVTSIVEHKAFEGLAYSGMFINSAAKQATAMYNKTCSGTVTVEGASAKAQGDIKAILKMYEAQVKGDTLTVEEAACIPANKVIVPKEWEKKFKLKKGQKLFIYRNPYNATIACVVEIFDFSDVRDTIQLSALDNNSHNLASDNDGDTIYATWNKDIINMAERSSNFAKECGAKVLAYKTGAEDKSQRGIPADKYLSDAPENGSVGKVCEPLFGLVSLIPWGCDDPDQRIFVGKNGADQEIYTTPREIYTLLGHGFVGTTYAIDSAKKHYKNAYAETAQTKRITAIINKGIYWTKVFYHPNEVKFDYATGKLMVNGTSRNDIGENGGLATLAKIAMGMICDKLCGNLLIISDFRDVLKDYTWTEKGVLHRSRGFVFNANKLFHGIDKGAFLKVMGDVVTDEAGECKFDTSRFERVNKSLVNNGGLVFDAEILANNGAMCEGKVLRGNEFKTWLACNLPLRTMDMTSDEMIKAVSLVAYRYNDVMTVGRLRTRIQRAKSNATAFEGYYGRKGKVREKVDEHIMNVIKMWVYMCNNGVECTDDEATDILYNEVASFLFSGNAGELYGSDMQAFLGNKEFTKRLFAQECKWLINKVNAGEIKFDDLTPFEKDLVMGNIMVEAKADEKDDEE